MDADLYRRGLLYLIDVSGAPIPLRREDVRAALDTGLTPRCFRQYDLAEGRLIRTANAALAERALDWFS